MPNTLVIVGAGFSGTVLAANLLRRPPPKAVDIVLVERGSSMGRGAAYATHEFPYLLNVPAARLSADSGDPLQFLRFAQGRLAGIDGEDFLPRALYGDYLQDLLQRAEGAARDDVRLIRIFDEVTGLQRRDGQWPFAAQFARRAAIPANAVILALGAPPPPPPAWAASVWDHGAFRQDPRDLPNTLTAEHKVLIVGNGLTMVDAVSLLSRDPKRVPTLYTISRRGLLPRPQTAFRAGAIQGSGEALLAHAHSLKALLNACRKLAREVETPQGDWREAVSFIRNLAPSLWRRLPAAERVGEVMIASYGNPAAGEVDLYPQEVTRVLLNLISNGFYAATKRKAQDGNTNFEPILAATTKNLGDRVEIRIRDNGTGIPPEVKEKMFNPFFTTKPAGEGTGLGLSISHDIIVKQHAGSIVVDTQPGEFTEFKIVLPRKAAAIGSTGGRA